MTLTKIGFFSSTVVSNSVVTARMQWWSVYSVATVDNQRFIDHSTARVLPQRAATPFQMTAECQAMLCYKEFHISVKLESSGLHEQQHFDASRSEH